MRIYKICFTFYLLLLLPLYSFSQANTNNSTYIDSLRQALSASHNDSDLVNIYVEIADYFYNQNSDSLILYGTKAEKKATLLKDTSNLFFTSELLGYAYDEANQYDKSFHYFRKSLTYAKALHDTSFMAHSCHNIAYVISHSHNQPLSLQYFLKSLSLAEAIQDTSTLPDVYYNIGTYYEAIKNYESAKQYYTKSLNISRQLNDLSLLVPALANLAHINIKLNHKNEAYENYLEADSLLQYINDHYSLGLSYATFIDYFIELEDIESAQHYLRLTDLLAQRENNAILRAEVLKQSGDIHYLNQRYEDAIWQYNESIKLLKRINNPEPLSELYQQKSKAFAKIAEYKMAHEALQTSNQLDDSLKMKEVARLLGEFEHEQRSAIEIRNSQLTQALEQKEAENLYLRTKTSLNVTIIALIFFVLTSVVSIVIFFSIKRRNKQLQEQKDTIEETKTLLEQHVAALKKSEQDLKEMNITKDKFFSIIAHDLRNPFNTLIGFSNLIKSDKEIRYSDDFDQIASSMYNSASFGYQLLENLLNWAQTQTNQIKHQPEDITLEEILHRNISLLKESANSKNIQIKLYDKHSHRVYADRNMLNTIIRNLLSNAVKFSYENSEIQVHVKTENDKVITTIVDHGIGISESDQEKLFKLEEDVQHPGTANERGTGLGLILCKEFIEMNDGEIGLRSQIGKGCTVSFSLPKTRKGSINKRKTISTPKKESINI